MEKRCNKCLIVKPLSEFATRLSGIPDWACKSCKSIMRKDRYWNKGGKLRDHNRYKNRTKTIKKHHVVIRGKKGQRIIDKRLYDKCPEKVRTRSKTAYAIKIGKLIKGKCEKDGPDCMGVINAHHSDYSKPLEVRWLCTRHHQLLHHTVLNNH